MRDLASILLLPSAFAQNARPIEPAFIKEKEPFFRNNRNDFPVEKRDDGQWHYVPAGAAIDPMDERIWNKQNYESEYDIAYDTTEFPTTEESTTTTTTTTTAPEMVDDSWLLDESSESSILNGFGLPGAVKDMIKKTMSNFFDDSDDAALIITVDSAVDETPPVFNGNMGIPHDWMRKKVDGNAFPWKNYAHHGDWNRPPKGGFFPAFNPQFPVQSAKPEWKPVYAPHVKDDCEKEKNIKPEEEEIEIQAKMEEEEAIQKFNYQRRRNHKIVRCMIMAAMSIGFGFGIFFVLVRLFRARRRRRALLVAAEVADKTEKQPLIIA